METRNRKKEEEEKDERFYRIERSYGVFTRSIRPSISGGWLQGERRLQQWRPHDRGTEGRIEQGNLRTDQDRV